MSLLRPTCATLARRLCTTQSPLERTSRSPILALIQRHQKSRPQCRSFASTPRCRAQVTDLPQNPTIPQTRRRTVRIGPLPQGQVNDNTIQRIFGRKLSPTEGNNVLRILHHRRTSGSLADYGVDNLGKQYTHVSRESALKGLEWLREKYPIDEARAAEEWAEKEANRISYELWLADPETESKYKDSARAFREQMEKDEQERLQQEAEDRKIGILHVGKSQFERNIEEKRRERLEEITRIAEEKEREEREMEKKLETGEWVRTPTGKQLMKPGQTAYIDIFGNENVSRRKEELQKYQMSSVLTDAKSPEELLAKTTLVQRLYPMTAFVLLTVLISYGFAHYYLPPSPAFRMFPDVSPTTATIAALLAMNGAVILAFQFMPLWPFLTRYFMHIPAYPRAITSVTNVFAHLQWEHFFHNMFFLCLVGSACCDLVGRGTFVGTYISAGAVGTLASLYWANLGRGNIMVHSVGASAAIWGVAALYCLLTDTERIKIPFFKDKEVMFWPKMLFGAFVVFEVLAAVKKGKGKYDHASHFGGMFVGATTAGYLRANGWQERKSEGKTVDVGASVREIGGKLNPVSK